MRILFANLPSTQNRFMSDLKMAIENENCEVIWDCDEFWTCKNTYDIIHIHWPEYLSVEMYECLLNTDPIPKELWEKTIQCLEYWKKNSTIVYTRHVQYPHMRHDDEFLNLYRVVTSYCHTVIHFANYSIQQFKEFYPEHLFVNHVVIPHHNYESLPNLSTRRNARKQLGIDDSTIVMLIFGAVKEHEKELITKAFNCIESKNKVLLAPGWKVPRRKIWYIRLREWVWKFEKWLAKQNKTKRIDLGFIPEDDAHLYFNASDFLFIPRVTELNSGNITCGFTFGLVVVGKDDADIGEILKDTGNPTFRVSNDESLSKAIHKAIELKNDSHGEKNRKLALEKWNTEIIGKEYVQTFQNSIKENKEKD